ncbi:MAG: tetratricopeptide repeat protein [Bacteroidia bacterium]|nr:tetratricopeptide repeat protein [Bacteroidia bacterium]
MLKTQWIIISVALLAILGLYQLPKVVVNTSADLPIDQASVSAPDQTSTPADQTPIPENVSQKLNALKISFHTAREIKQKQTLADSVTGIYKNFNQWDSAAVYASYAAREIADAESWWKAADTYFEAHNYYTALDNAKAQNYGEQARYYYQKILAKDSLALDAQAKMAVTFVNSPNPMQGIQMLLKVLATDENNKLALFHLGSFSIQSGQYDKASQRLEKLLSLDSSDSRAKLLLSQAYINLGQSNRAKELLENLILTEQDSLLRAAANDYLNQLK